jgi:hypothetical protein
MDISKKNKNIAIYNGFPFHYEMFGYFLYYFLVKKKNIVIYCHLNDSNGYIEFYNNIFQNYEYNFEYRCVSLFESEKNQYDLIILVTDDDISFNTTDEEINNRTIRIDHSIIIRNNSIKKHIATRPYFNGIVRPWSLPCFPIINLEKKINQNNNNNEINIMILGDSEIYHISLINRLKSEKKIILHAISRNMDKSKFLNLNENINLKIYKNINALQLFEIGLESNYIFTDVAYSPEYENMRMSGSIPFSFSLLTPLIISKQSNSHYNFKNIIEFDKYSDEPILLENLNNNFFINLENERLELIKMHFSNMNYYCNNV